MQYRPKIRNIVLHLPMKNGRLASYHEMLNGKDHGKHMTYYRSGQIANERQFDVRILKNNNNITEFCLTLRS